MRSNQKFLATLQNISEITGIECLLFYGDGKLLCTNRGMDEELLPEMVKGVALAFSGSGVEQQTASGYRWFRLEIDGADDYIFAMHTVSDSDEKLVQMALSQVRIVAESFVEQYDRSNFVQNVLLGNMLKVEIFRKAKKLHIEQLPRVVYVIDTGKHSNEMAMELVKNLSDLKTKDFITTLDEHMVVLIKDISNIDKNKWETELELVAKRLADTIHSEAMIRVRVGYGNVVEQIPDIAQSYQEAKMALEVGRIFYAEYDTICYSRLGIGRLIYQLPYSLCDMYIKEVFGEDIPEILEDEEAMSTINKFFENNLNISETARQLYVHRNTLVYRLERIEKAIGLDIRSFDQAMTFRIAVMVLAHMRMMAEK